MDNLRLILILCGVLLVVGIYVWEIRRRRARSDEAAKTPDGGYPEARDGPSADPFDTPLDGLRDVVAKRDLGEGVTIGDLGSIGDMGAKGEPGPRAPDLGGDAAKAVDSEVPATGAGVSKPRFPEPEKVGEELFVVLTVMAKEGQQFTGDQLREAFENVGMRYGDMQIFHHYGVGEHIGPQPVFSAANVLKPGILDIDTLDDLSTTGLSLFMHLPGALDGKVAFELMLNTAQRLADRLGGELCDENRAALTPHTIPQIRERISEYERRQSLPVE